MAAISFLVPTFNRAHFLSETLSAILRQMRDGDELLIIDDGSTDDTAAIVAAAGARARYIRQDNSGKAVALNRGLAATSAPLVWICDDDDILLAGAVESLAEAMTDPRLGFAFGRYTRFQDQPDGVREDMGTGYWPDLSSGSLARHMLEDAFVMQNAALVRRKAYEAVGPFSEAMPRSLDYEMFVRLAVTHPCVYVDRLMFLQRKHEGARGPASMLHAAARSEDVWQRYDRLIFINLYRHAPLAFFEGMYEGDDAHRRRAGLLCRGGIMMRHGCWEEALSDLEAAAAIPLPGLDAGEIRICRRALEGKHGFGGILREPDALRRMAALACQARGGEIVRTMIDGTMWRVRHRGDQRRHTLTLIYRLLGLRGGLALAAMRLRHSSAERGIRERDQLDTGVLLGAQLVPPVGVAESARAA